MWFTKSKRAQNVDDFETWIAGGVSPTLNTMDNNGEAFATVLVLAYDEFNDSISDIHHTLRAGTKQSTGVLIIDGTRVNDVRVYEDGIVPTVISRYGTGGGNVPMIFPIQNTVIGRADENGPGGKGFKEDGEPMFTLDTTSPHAVAYPIDDAREIEKHQNGTGIGEDGAPAYTLDRQQAPAVVAVFQQSSMQGRGTIGAVENAQVSKPVKTQSDYQMIATPSIVRRLTPMECERLQGFPDDWTADQADSNRYKQCGNAVAVPVVEWIVSRMVEAINE